ncbi:hypothetical protein ANACOL_02737 [Anaerotruncus colihominis DSM 17241]|uniref:Uncharacterized protein n=1 Tax=Anaerotruncus colihominis DSM 17241 TaxID=445972 RepID=B0PDV3_9FIRM|nr:hypothetical protein ANACOL_02737 [Anaerotruncus colihominis DSM 17241]
MPAVSNAAIFFIFIKQAPPINQVALILYHAAGCFTSAPVLWRFFHIKTDKTTPCYRFAAGAGLLIASL